MKVALSESALRVISRLGFDKFLFENFRPPNRPSQVSPPPGPPHPPIPRWAHNSKCSMKAAPTPVTLNVHRLLKGPVSPISPFSASLGVAKCSSNSGRRLTGRVRHSCSRANDSRVDAAPHPRPLLISPTLHAMRFSCTLGASDGIQSANRCSFDCGVAIYTVAGVRMLIEPFPQTLTQPKAERS